MAKKLKDFINPKKIVSKVNRLAVEKRLLFDGAGFVTGEVAVNTFTMDQHTDNGAYDPDPDDSATLELMGALAESNTDIYIIDKNLPELSSLLDSIPAGADILLLSDDESGVAAVSNYLSLKDNISSIHIITHATAAGELQLGSDLLDQESISGEFASSISAWSTSLTEGADILIYGCNLAESAAGVETLSTLSQMLSVDIAASTDITGISGNWELEYSLGNIESVTFVSNQWQHDLFLNTAPVAVADVALVNEDSVANKINVLANDTDLNGDTLTVTSASALNGTVTINADNTLSYTPKSNFFGVDTITYTIRDSQGANALLPGTVVVTVTNINDLPFLLLPEIPLLTEDTPLIFAELLGTSISIGDIDGAIAEVTLSVPLGSLSLSQTSGLTLSQGDGVNDSVIKISGNIVDINAALNGLIYTPDADYNGPVTLTIGLTDTLLSLPITTVLPISIGAVADINNDTVSLEAGQSTSFNVMDNDTFENALASVTSYTTPEHGSISLDSEGNAVYTPDPDFIGVDTFTYTVTSSGTQETATVTIHVLAAPNYAPVAVGEFVSVNENASITIDVLSNDSDANGDSLNVTEASALNGSVTINPDGTLTYVPTLFFNGSDTITYSISDGLGGIATATVSVTVLPVNQAPVVLPDVAVTSEDSEVTVNILANDMDIDGDTLSIIAATADHGTLTINPNGSVTYTPDPNFNGVDTAVYTVSDGQGGLSTTTLTITVNSINDAPVVASGLTASVDEDSTVIVDVLASASDVDGDILSITAVSAENGTVTVNPDGTISYTPNADFVGSDTITYTISDGQGGETIGTIAVTVNAINDAPVVASGLTASVDEDSTVVVDVLAGASDVDGDVLNVAAVSADNGIVTINPDGTISYTPNADFVGSDTITYTISDGQGGETIGTIAVTVNAVNDAPVVASNLNISTDEDLSVTVDVLASASDVDGDILSITAVSAENGTVTVNPDGTISYTPNADFVGSDTITYTISDGQGGETIGTIAVTVNAINDAPVLASGLTASVDEDSTVVVDVLAGASDVDGDVLNVAAVSAENGTVTVNPDGTISYTPNADFVGSDTITYTISDAQGEETIGTIAVTVNAVNDAPVVASGLTASVDEDSAVIVDVLAGASDVDGDVLSVTAVSAENGVVTVNPDGTVSYTPNPDFVGSDTITYTISDGQGGETIGTIAVTVNAVNDAPVVASGLTASVDEDSAVIVDVLAGASDVDGDVLNVAAVSADNGIVTINPDGTISYTPNTDFVGSDTIIYTISDGRGGETIGTIAVTVNAVNDAPVVASGLTASVDEDSTVVVDVLAGASDVDGDILNVTAVSAENGTVTVNPDGAISYTPNADFVGSDTITYTISDGQGGETIGTIAVTVNAINDAPVVASGLTASVDEDSTVVVDVLAGASDIDGDVLNIAAISAENGVVTVNPDGTISYTPNTDFVGSDTITYTISDGQGGETIGTIAVTVNAVNDAPVLASNLNISTDEDSSVTVDVLASASDVDGDVLSVTAASAENGTVALNPDGTISYTPNADFVGSDTITYTISDGQGGDTIGTIAVTVNAVNDAPVLASGLTASVDEDSTVIVDVLTGVSDVDGDILSVTAVSAENGTVTVNPDGTISYTPNPDFVGSDTITYTISDGQGGETIGTIAVTVNAVNDAPVVASGLTASVDEDSTVIVDVLASASDVDGDVLNVAAASAENGVVTVNPDGTISYTPNADFVGSDTITYTISDAQGGETIGTIAVTVNAVNDAPVVASGLTASVDEDSTVIVDVLAGASDVDGDILSVTAASAENGSVTVNPDGTISYTPNADFVGSDTITYTISDGQGGETIGTIAVTVNAVNDAPVLASGLTATVDEDSTVIVDVLAAASDIDGDVLNVTAVSAENGTVTVNPDGTISYTPNADFVGSDTITYTISDGRGGETIGTIAVTVNAVNDAPVAASNLNISIDEDSSVTVDVLAGASDIDGDVLNVAAVSADNGIVTINPDGTISYTPNADFVGSDTITYTILDGQGGETIGTIAMTVNAVNDAPVVASGFTASVDEDSTVVVDVLAGASDVDGDVLNVAAVSAENGTVTVNPDGTISYTPNPDFVGSDTITYTISDGRGGETIGTIAVTVNAVNDAPILASGLTASVDEDSTVIVDVLAGASDIDGDVLNVAAVSADNGIVTINPDGTISYTPNADFVGSDTITYTILDGQGGETIGTIAVTVNAVNDAPVAASGLTASVDEDSTVVVDVLTGVSDVDGDVLSVTAASAENGTVALNPDGTISYTPNADFVGSDTITYTISDGQGGETIGTIAVTVNAVNDAPVVASGLTASVDEDSTVVVDVLAAASDIDGDVLNVTAVSAENGTVTINPDGTISYTPNPNFNGSDIITYTIIDGQGGESIGTIAVTVNAVNDAPVLASGLTASVDEDSTVIVDVLASASDVDGDVLSVTAASAENGTVALNPDGTISYTPNADFVGSDTITYTISDGQGGETIGTIAVTVNAVNDAPVVASGLTATVDEDSTVIVDVLTAASDADGDVLNITAASAENGTVTINPDGTISYTPNPNFNGSDTITYTIIDGQGGETIGRIAVTINPINDAPTTTATTVVTQEDTALAVTILERVNDVDGDVIQVTGALADNGTIVIANDGTITYTPNPDFYGTDAISYRIQDSHGAVTEGIITVNVTPVNDAPTSEVQYFTINKNNAIELNLSEFIQDIDHDDISIVNISAANGSIALLENGKILYTPHENYTGQDNINYTFSDGRATGIGSVIITIAAENSNEVSNENSQEPAASNNLFFNGGDSTQQARSDGSSNTLTAMTKIQYDPVILEAINGISQLGGIGEISDATPTLAALNKLNSLDKFNSGNAESSQENLESKIQEFNGYGNIDSGVLEDKDVENLVNTLEMTENGVQENIEEGFEEQLQGIVNLTAKEINELLKMLS